MTDCPFVIGEWVRGRRFYGRHDQIAAVLDGPGSWYWLFGLRRVGKTSLLRQLEHLAAAAPERRDVPIFWQAGTGENPEALHQHWQATLEHAGERLQRLGIDTAEVEGDDLPAALVRLVNRLRSQERRLLLLVDEAEGLIKLKGAAPDLFSELRTVLQSQRGLRAVLASCLGQRELAEQRDDNSPRRHGFTPARYVRPLANDDALALIRQTHLPTAERPGIDDDTAGLIRERCDNHPFLIQRLCRDYLALGNLDAATEVVAGDRTVSVFFAADFAMLSDTERSIVSIVAERDATHSHSVMEELPVEISSLIDSLHRLEHLGFIRRNDERRFAVKNLFFRRWLQDMPAWPPPLSRRPRRRRASESDTESPTSARPWTLPVLRDQNPDVFEDRYELRRRIGRGALGVVYQAWDRRLHCEIALKILKPEYAANPQALASFRQEILLSRDVGHPNILRIYDLGESGGYKYLTMQLVRGPTLSRLISSEAPLPPETVLTLGRKLALALDATHARRVVHLDVKPRNVLVGEGYEPYLTDFGLARLLGAEGRVAAGTIFAGTPNYASPEQARLESLDERSDLYSLGLLLFELATGRRPFPAESLEEALAAHRDRPAPDPRVVEPGVPEGLARVILRCLEKDPEKRYAGARGLHRALRALVEEPILS